jgi:hypothetical protein
MKGKEQQKIINYHTVWEWPDLEVEGVGTTEIFRQIGLPSRRLRYGGELAALRLVVVLVGLSPRKLFAP